MEIEWSRLKAWEIKSLGERNAIAIVPIGATEQHGPHLPVMVDARLAGEVSLRAARIVAQHKPVVVLPTIWCGMSEHHMSLSGTITLDFATMAAVVRCVCESLLRHGFRRIFVLNGHGGNTAALETIVTELTVKHRLLPSLIWESTPHASNRREHPVNCCLAFRMATLGLLSHAAALPAYEHFFFWPKTHNGALMPAKSTRSHIK